MQIRPAWVGPRAAGQAAIAKDGRGALGQIQLALRDLLEAYRPHLPAGARPLLVVALSGGADSLALAAALPRVAGSPRFAWPTAALSVDHRWRPEAAAEAHAAIALARDFGIAHGRVLTLPAAFQAPPATHKGAAQTPASPSPAESGVAGQQVESQHIESQHIDSQHIESLGPEGAARLGRWQALVQGAQEIAAAQECSHILILTGHTLDDQAETVLLGLGRGASLRSLAAMQALGPLPRGVTLAGPAWLEGQAGERRPVLTGKPLLQIRRAQTEECCRDLGLDPVRDPSNAAQGPARTAKGAPLPRAAIRENVLPALAAALGQDPIPALARFAANARADEAALAAAAQEALESAWVGRENWKPGAPIRLRVASLTGLHPAVLRRTLHLAGSRFGWRGAEIKSSHLEAMEGLVRDWHGQGPLPLPGTMAARIDGHIVLR